MPVGFKNGTDGNVGVAVDAVRAAAAPHAFAGIDVTGTPAILHTRGNPDCHIILRGGPGRPQLHSRRGGRRARPKLRAAGLPERVVVDASHGNSGKDHTRQPLVVADLAEQIAAGNDAIVGVMLESFIAEGRQDLGDGAEAHLRPVDHRRLHGVGHHRRGARPARRRGAQAARRRLTLPR